MLVFLLHSMKLLFTKPIPPNPAPSKIIPIISETLYIYLIGFQLIAIMATIISFNKKSKPPIANGSTARHRRNVSMIVIPVVLIDSLQYYVIRSK